MQNQKKNPAGAGSTRGVFFLVLHFQEAANVEIDFRKSGGLVPAIIQDARSGDVLMLGFMNAESLEETQRTGEVVFFSRSRSRLWKKGESSGHLLRVRQLPVDSDPAALLVPLPSLLPAHSPERHRS